MRAASWSTVGSAIATSRRRSRGSVTPSLGSLTSTRSRTAARSASGRCRPGLDRPRREPGTCLALTPCSTWQRRSFDTGTSAEVAEVARGSCSCGCSTPRPGAAPVCTAGGEGHPAKPWVDLPAGDDGRRGRGRGRVCPAAPPDRTLHAAVGPTYTCTVGGFALAMFAPQVRAPFWAGVRRSPPARKGGQTGSGDGAPDLWGASPSCSPRETPTGAAVGADFTVACRGFVREGTRVMVSNSEHSRRWSRLVSWCLDQPSGTAGPDRLRPHRRCVRTGRRWGRAV